MSRGDTTRQAVLDRAFAIASATGLESLTIGSLAEAVGLSKSGLFAHFRSREQLQVAVLKDAVDRFVAGVVVPALKAPRGEPRVRALFEHWQRWKDELPGSCIIHAAATELAHRPGEPQAFLQSALRDWTDTIATAASIAVAEGHFRADLDRIHFAFEFEAIALSYMHFTEVLGRDRARELALASFEQLLSRSRPASA